VWIRNGVKGEEFQYKQIDNFFFYLKKKSKLAQEEGKEKFKPIVVFSRLSYSGYKYKIGNIPKVERMKYF
jgi:hypothetical protein